MSAWARGLRAVREFIAVQVELQERAALLARPWEEELLHWSGDSLHGVHPPPSDGRQRSVTRGGWCPGVRAAARRQ